MTLANEIAALQQMTTAELAAEFTRLHGRPPRYRSVPWLRKRISFALQVAAHGGLRGPARAELDRLAAEVRVPASAPTVAATHGDAPTTTTEALRPGTILTRDWRGRQIRVLVTTSGFDFDGQRFGSLSAVAFAITGSKWNGRLFFGLTTRGGPR
ncbi:MAG: DUF2924 domain-containing protein [Planctomycetes bacterium]|nr:DUF2924 domain-containing protein [Planctomycetota bacterium]MCC7399427.1 DUF2924 domain-containing protein [Planctomycetota bacterium]